MLFGCSHAPTEPARNVPPARPSRNGPLPTVSPEGSAIRRAECRASTATRQGFQILTEFYLRGQHDQPVLHRHDPRSRSGTDRRSFASPSVIRTLEGSRDHDRSPGCAAATRDWKGLRALTCSSRARRGPWSSAQQWRRDPGSFASTTTSGRCTTIILCVGGVVFTSTWREIRKELVRAVAQVPPPAGRSHTSAHAVRRSGSAVDSAGSLAIGAHHALSAESSAPSAGFRPLTSVITRFIRPGELIAGASRSRPFRSRPSRPSSAMFQLRVVAGSAGSRMIWQLPLRPSAPSRS